MKVTRDYNNLLNDYNQFIKENEILSQQNNDLIEDLDKLKRDYSAFKSCYEDIYSGDIYRIWKTLKKLSLQSLNSNLIILLWVMDYISAESKDKAIEWLGIVKTALIFVESNDEFSYDLNNVKDNILKVKQDYEISNNFENFGD